jgi:hypothetical protein
MRKVCYALTLAILFSGSSATSAQQGTVTRLTLSHGTADTGTTVTATVTGSAGVCGGVHINWGDGEAVTYPTSYLPVSKTHTYTGAGNFVVRAQGMGNCVGEATARLTVNGPPAPPAPAVGPLGGQISNIEVRPRAARPNEPVTIIVNGRGLCPIVVDFDDGQDRRVTERLPYSITYRFADARPHEIMAWTDEPCNGSGEMVVRIRR